MFQDPEKDVRRIMAQIGYRDIDVQCKRMLCTYKTKEECKSERLFDNNNNF